MTTQNEAAERLLRPLDWEPTAQEVVSYRLNANDPAMRDYNWQEWRAYTTRRLLDEALAAERRATVERIRAAMYAIWGPGFYSLHVENEEAEQLVAILDEEAKGHHPTGEGYATEEAAPSGEKA